MYFGTVFITKTMNGHPHILSELIAWDTVLTSQRGQRKLKEAAEDIRITIKEDLARLKLAKILAS